MEYKPNPIDTSEVILPEGVLEIVEYLAKNTHEVWASGKMKEGYRYGTENSIVEKTHSSLVPYEELSESEKDFDRNTLLETIKLLLKMGYVIEKPSIP